MRPIHTLPIPSPILTKLLDEGYLFCEDIFDDNKGIRNEVKKMLHFVPNETWDDIEHLIVVPAYRTATEIFQDELKVKKIVTFSQAIDQILGGGVFLGEVVEFCGASGSGKTQMCLQLCVAVQLPTSLGGVLGEALYIDTDNSFTPARLKDIVESCGKLYSEASGWQRLKLESHIKNLDESKLLKGVHYINIQDNIQLLAVVIIIEEFIKKNDKVKLIIIDSLTFPFLDPFITNNLVRTQQICRIIRQLQSIAANYSLAVVITNQLTTKIVQQEAKLAPAMGENYAHILSKRIIFGNLQNSKFSAAVYKSSYLPELYSEFEISSDGIRDVTFTI